MSPTNRTPPRYFDFDFDAGPRRAPALRHVTRLVRDANRYWEGGEWAVLAYRTDQFDCWAIEPVSTLASPGEQFGREYVPGDNAPVDAAAIARRLLAAFRDAR